ncbi:hypothetical protein A0H81_10965 [Grifola frondosa]|uniref:Uncharacterized protein n=1 Tax=Grifola frondosa TaxID=5627 RepID=A0A1C7LX86_GRIFR|nr:hypothetical protein A0H81_10965 [Grifola frondosa]
MVRRRHHVDEEPYFGEDKITPVLRRTDIDPDIDAEPRPYTYGTLNGNVPLATGASAVRGSTTDTTNPTQPQRREPPPGIPMAAEARSPSSRSEPARSPPLTADASVTSSTGHLESPHLPLHVVNPNADRPHRHVKGAIVLRPDGYSVVPGQPDAEAVSPGAGSSGAAPQQVRGREPYVHQDSGRVQAAADVRAPSHSKLASGMADADAPPPAYTE